MNDQETEEMINLLIQLNFNVGSKGFIYWIYSIEQNKYNNKELNEIYKELALKENKTTQQIEGAMKYARKNSDRLIRSYYNYKGKITNKIILNLINMKGA